MPVLNFGTRAPAYLRAGTKLAGRTTDELVQDDTGGLGSQFLSGLGRVGTWLSSLEFGVKNLLMGNPEGALRNVGDLVTGLPTLGLYQPQWMQMARPQDRPEATDVMRHYGIAPPQSALGRFGINVAGGILLDPLSYIGLPVSAAAKRLAKAGGKLAKGRVFADAATDVGRKVLAERTGEMFKALAAKPFWSRALKEGGEGTAAKLMNVARRGAASELAEEVLKAAPADAARLFRMPGIRAGLPFTTGRMVRPSLKAPLGELGEEAVKSMRGPLGSLARWTVPGMAVRVGRKVAPGTTAAAVESAQAAGKWIRESFSKYSGDVPDEAKRWARDLDDAVPVRNADTATKISKYADLGEDVDKFVGRRYRQMQFDLFNDAAGKTGQEFDDILNRTWAKMADDVVREFPEKAEALKGLLGDVQDDMVKALRESMDKGMLQSTSIDPRVYLPLQFNADVAQALKDATNNPRLGESLKDVFTNMRKHKTVEEFEEAIRKWARSVGAEIGPESVMEDSILTLWARRMYSHNRAVEQHKFLRKMWGRFGDKEQYAAGLGNLLGKQAKYSERIRKYQSVLDDVLPKAREAAERITEARTTAGMSIGQALDSARHAEREAAATIHSLLWELGDKADRGLLLKMETDMLRKLDVPQEVALRMADAYGMDDLAKAIRAIEPDPWEAGLKLGYEASLNKERAFEKAIIQASQAKPLEDLAREAGLASAIAEERAIRSGMSAAGMLLGFPMTGKQLVRAGMRGEKISGKLTKTQAMLRKVNQVIEAEKARGFIPKPKNMAFNSPEVAEFTKRMVQGLGRRTLPERVLNRINRFYKANLTVGFMGVPNVSFHVRNTMSGLTQSLTDPDVGFKGVKALWNTFTELPFIKLFGLKPTAAGRLSRALTNPAKYADTVADIMLKDAAGNVLYTGKQFVELAQKHNLIGALQTLDVFGRKGIISNAAKGRGGLKAFAREWMTNEKLPRAMMQSVEGNMRVNAFAELLKKGVEPAEAAARIKRMFVDYTVQSRPDRVLRDIIPFARFSTGTVPVVAAEAAKRPVFFSSVAKIPRVAQKSVGKNVLLPEYIQEQTPVPTGLTDEDGNPVVIGQLGVIHEELGKWLNIAQRPGPTLRKSLLGALSPGLKVPLEAMTGKDFFFGGDYGSYTRAPAWLRLTGLATKRTTKSGKEYYTVPGWVNAALSATPVSRQFSTVNQLMDERKSGVTRLVNVLTGIRAASVDQRRERLKRLEELLKQYRANGDVGTMQLYYALSKNDPELKEILDAYNAEKKGR